MVIDPDPDTQRESECRLEELEAGDLFSWRDSRAPHGRGVEVFMKLSDEHCYSGQVSYADVKTGVAERVDSDRYVVRRFGRLKMEDS